MIVKSAKSVHYTDSRCHGIICSSVIILQKNYEFNLSTEPNHMCRSLSGLVLVPETTRCDIDTAAGCSFESRNSVTRIT